MVEVAWAVRAPSRSTAEVISAKVAFFMRRDLEVNQRLPRAGQAAQSKRGRRAERASLVPFYLVISKDGGKCFKEKRDPFNIDVESSHDHSASPIARRRLLAHCENRIRLRTAMRAGTISSSHRIINPINKSATKFGNLPRFFLPSEPAEMLQKGSFILVDRREATKLAK